MTGRGQRPLPTILSGERLVGQPTRFDFDAHLATWSNREVRLRGVALVRLGLATSSILLFVVHMRDRHFLWGPDAFSPWSYQSTGFAWRGNFTLLSFSDSMVWFEIVYFGGLAAAILCALFGGRLLCFLTWILVLSILHRTTVLQHGGHNALAVCFPLVALTRSNAFYALKSPIPRPFTWRVPNAMVGASRMLHNFGVLLLTFQIVVIYLMAGYWKLIGEVWIEGTAMYYIMQNDEFTFIAVPPALLSNWLFVTAVTYSIVVVEVALAPAVIWNKGERIVAGMLIIMHLGIAILMHLAFFALVMISLLALFLPARGRPIRSDTTVAARSG